MQGVKLTLTCKDKNGDALLSGGHPVTLNFEMEATQVIDSGTKSIFQTELVEGSAGTMMSFLMTSDFVSVLFGYFDDVYYGVPPAAPPTLMTCTDQGTDADPIAVKIFAGPPANQPHNTQIRVFSFDFKLKNTGISFLLTNTDVSAMFLFMDSMLWSNPPNPPH